MADKAKVTSIDALESFRATLVRYLERARRSLDEAAGETRRTRSWLDGDRRLHWDFQVRQRQRLLDQAEQELYSAMLSDDKQVHVFRKMAVLKARRRLEEAEEKLKAVKQWQRRFDQQVEPLLRRLESTHDMVSHHLPLALASLDRTITVLQSYAESRPAPQPPPAEAGPPSSGENVPPEPGAAP